MTIEVHTVLWSNEFEHLYQVDPSVWKLLGLNVQLFVEEVVEEIKGVVSRVHQRNMQNFDYLVNKDKN